MLFWIVILVCIHFNLFVNIRDYRFQFYSLQWEVRQLIESTIFTMILLFGRYAYFAYAFPKDYRLLKLNVRSTEA